jgi:anti-sigma factor RsiW
MIVSKDVIADLLPLYAAGECSEDSKNMVETYFREHPAAARELRDFAAAAKNIHSPLERTVEMKAFARTRRLLRIRSSWLAGAIFFSIAPFSFLYTNGQFYWMFQQSPPSALVYAVLGIACWVGYAVSRKQTKVFGQIRSQEQV